MAVDRDGRASGGGRLDAAAVALLVPADSGSQLLIVLADPVAPARIEVRTSRARMSFARIRRGPIVHGLIETYREAEAGALGDDGSLVSNASHETVWCPDAGRLFGAGDVSVAIPRHPERPWTELGIPWGAIGAARRVVLRRGAGARASLFDLAEELVGPGWACRVCGHLSPNPEPHTAAHGVPGHTHAGTLPGEPGDPTRSYPG